jgi:peptide/nickel transport system substrate-binding protein
LFNGFQTGAVDIAYQSLLPPQVRKLRTEAEQGNWESARIFWHELTL